MRVLALALLISSALTGAAEAGSYKLLNATGQMAAFYDADTIKLRGDTAYVWLMMSYAPKPAERQAFKLARVEFSCSAETDRFVSATSYSARGEVLETANVPTDPQAVIPDTITAALMRAACGGEANKDETVGSSPLDITNAYRAAVVAGKIR